MKLNIVSCPPVTTVLIKRPDLKYQLGFSVQNGIVSPLSPWKPLLCLWVVGAGGGAAVCMPPDPLPQNSSSDGAGPGHQSGQAGWVGQCAGGMGPSSPPGHPILVVVSSADPLLWSGGQIPPTCIWDPQAANGSVRVSCSKDTCSFLCSFIHSFIHSPIQSFACSSGTVPSVTPGTGGRTGAPPGVGDARLNECWSG